MNKEGVFNNDANINSENMVEEYYSEENNVCVNVGYVENNVYVNVGSFLRCTIDYQTTSTTQHRSAQQPNH